jgi:serine phosphatase RsbU (regulator of sigma subunit)
MASADDDPLPFGSDPERLSRLLDHVGQGLYTVDGAGTITGINAEGARLLGYEQASLIGRHAHETLHARRPDGSAYPVDQCPLLAVLRDGRPAEAAFDAFVDVDDTLLPVSWTSTPLLHDRSTEGAVVLFRSVASQARVEQQRTHALEAERRQRALVDAAHERLRMLSAITQALSSTLDAHEALVRLTRLVVPRIADWCVIDTVTRDRELHRVALAHRDPERLRTGAFERVLPSARGSTAPLARVLSGSGAVLVNIAEEYGGRDGGADELRRVQAALFAQLGATKAIIAPLAARGHVLGAITLAFDREGAHVTEHDVDLAEDVGRRAGLALDNAALHAGQRDVAETLQRSLMTTLPSVEHLSLAARYLPAGRYNRVGGDWYDSFVLPDGCTTLAIGDIAGHDVEAAARMGQVRNLLRAIAVDRAEPPSEIVRRLDLAVDALGAADFATLIFGKVQLVDTSRNIRELRLTNAGHPPPLLVHHDGRVTPLGDAPDLPLGVLPGEPRKDIEVALPPGSTVLLYTDGLIEHRQEDLSAGLARLRNAAGRNAQEPIEQFCDNVLSALGMPQDTGDDIAMLVLRVPLPHDDAPQHADDEHAAVAERATGEPQAAP